MKKKIMIMTVLAVIVVAMCMIMSSCGKKEVTCSFCNGKGDIPITKYAGTCVQCNGTGTDPRTNDTCGKCYGKGKYEVVVGRKPCRYCNGTGKVEE